MNKNFDSSFETGYPKIDEDHKELFDLIQDLEECMKSNDIKKATEIFSYFFHHIVSHFVEEEIIMYKERYPYDETQRHRDEHKRLQDLYLKHLIPVIRGEMPINCILVLFETQFLAHITEEDKPLAFFIQNKKISN